MKCLNCNNDVLIGALCEDCRSDNHATCHKMTCAICGEPTESGVDNDRVSVYHLECLKNTHEMAETRKYVQEVVKCK